jgi:N-acetylmuramoyl-L-alanine amidase
LSVSLLALTTAVGLAACSSDDSSSTTTTVKSSTTTTTAESAATIRFDKAIQQELADVGCYPGEVDGIIGAKTDAAILEFQKYAGLKADGELGPQTEEALKEAVAKGEKVCDANTTTTTPATTTTAASGGSPCTATALLEGIGGDPSTSITNYVCSDGYAAGTLGDGSTKFILVATDGSWERPSQDPCGSASAGLPPIILEDGCPS